MIISFIVFTTEEFFVVAIEGWHDQVGLSFFYLQSNSKCYIYIYIYIYTFIFFIYLFISLYIHYTFKVGLTSLVGICLLIVQQEVLYAYKIYIQINQWMSQSDYPILGVEIARARKRFSHPLLTGKPATMTQSAQTTIPPYQP